MIRLCTIVLLILVVISSHVYGLPISYSNNPVLDSMKFSYEDKVYFSDELLVQEVFVSNKLEIVDKNAFTSIKKYIVIGDSDKYTIKYIIENSYKLLAKVNIGSGKSIYYVLLNNEQINKLQKHVSINRIIEDGFFYKNILDYIKNKDLFKRIMSNRSTINVLNYYDYLPSLDLIKVPNVWSKYNLFGENVVIGIVDTGIDFANPDLGLEAIARDSFGNPLILSIDNGLILFTNVSIKINNTLVTENTVIDVFDPVDLALYRVKLGYNVTIGSINSLTGIYKVGLLPYYFIALYLSNTTRIVWVKTHVLAIMVDEEIPGFYNRVYFDLSSAFYELSTTMRRIEKEILGTSFWREPLLEWLDHSIVDEDCYKPGYEVIARDFDKDSLYDFSLGTISGYYLDMIGLINNTPGYYIGWDYSGRFLSIMFDYIGHGTRVATIAAGRGSRIYIGYNGLFRVKGVAPLSKIATGAILRDYDTFILEAWLCGYKPVFRKIGDIYYIEFSYYGPRRADVVNNSWSYVDTIKTTQNSPGLDILTYLYDAIIFNRTFIAGEPVLLVFAAGNSGPGYSSLHSPGTSLLTITVGASTWFKPLLDYGLNGLYDEIAPFSSRGPTGQGYPKPDLVSIGMFEYTSTRVIDGFGYGSIVDFFSGTSLATPYVSGALALLLNAYRNIYGQNNSLNPVIAKVLLKNSCDDLGYSPYIQGSGRLNVLKAIEKILLNKTVISVKNGLKNAFLENYANTYGEILYPIIQYFYDTSYYGIVKPGSMDNLTLVIENYVGEINIYTRELAYYKEAVIYDGVYDFKSILRVEIPKYAYAYSDYIELIILLENVSYPPFMFNKTPIDNKHAIVTYLIDWRDLDSDKIIDYYEQYVLSIDYRIGVETYLTIAKPDEKINGKLMLILAPSIYENIESIDIKIIIRAYNYRESNLFIYNNRVYVSNYSTINITISIPNNTIPGIYETALVIKYGNDTVSVPVSVLVPLILDNISTILIGLEYSDLRYYTFKLRGLYDIYNSFECSDWRILPILVTEPAITGVLFVARWSTGYSTDLAFTITPPGGVFTESGSINTFSTYKLASSIGLVYNPNLDDQMNNKLRMYLPIKWSTISRSSDIYGLYMFYNSNTLVSSPVLIYPGEYVNRGFEKYGLYRLYYSFTSYSGKLFEDQVSFRIIITRSSLEIVNASSINSLKQYRLKYSFSAGAYTPFYLSKIYVVSNNTISAPGYVLKPIPVAIYNQYSIIENLGYDLGIIYASRYLEGYIDILLNTTDTLEINVILWITDYPIRCEGFYLFIEYNSELIIHDIVYPGIISSYIVINNTN